MLDKKTFWMNALSWGCLAGVALFLVSLLTVLLDLKAGTVRLVVTVLILAAVIYVSGRQNAVLAGKDGYPYARAFGFVIAMMLFAGIVAGIGSWFLQNVIAPEYFDAQMAEALANAPQIGEAQASMMSGIMKNPVVILFGGTLNMVFVGGLIGLVVCAFVVRKPDVFAAE